MVIVGARYSMLDVRCALSFRPKRNEVENAPCGDAGGWAAGRDHHPGRSDETGDRPARVKSLTIVRSNNERCLHSGRHDKKTAGKGNSLCLKWRGVNVAGVDARGR